MVKYHVFANIVFKWINSNVTLTITDLHEFYLPYGFDGLIIYKFNFIILKELEDIDNPMFKFIDKNGVRYSNLITEKHIVRSEKQTIFEEGWCLVSELEKEMEHFKEIPIISDRLTEFKDLTKGINQKIIGVTND